MFGSIANGWWWFGFIAVVVGLLLFDLLIVQRKQRELTFKKALAWSVFWTALAAIFNVLVWHSFGAERGMEFLTGYVIELSLSIDNLFVFLVIFSYFSVWRKNQHRVLFWGILGAIVSRAAFILIGSALMQKFEWIIYVFGAVLIYTAHKLIRSHGVEVHPENNGVIRVIKKFLPVTHEYHGQKFFIRNAGKFVATPLFLVLIAIESTDIIFAVDSIPAVFAITRDPFIVFASNIAAILGLRSFFFLLSGMIGKFSRLHYGIGLVLAFVGIKMLLSEIYHIPIAASLAVVAVLIFGSILISLIFPKKQNTP